MVFLAAVMLLAIIRYGSAPHIPMLIGCCAASIGALSLGYRWQQIEDACIQGVTQSLSSILILLLIGVLMGVWIQSGVVPAMVYYGLKLITPKLMLPSSMLLCALVSMAVGSWGTMGTIGLALMGVASAMGISPGLAAGAIISGAYVGDKISPISDTVNLDSAVTEVDVVTAATKNAWIPLLSLLLSGIFFLLMGGGDADEAQMNQINSLMDGLSSAFLIHPACLLPLVILVACMALRVPTMPSLMAGIAAGAAQSMLVQGSAGGAMFEAAMYGYVGATGFPVLDELLTAGGLSSMLYSLSMIICAMAFGGIMQGTGQMRALLAPILRRVRGKGSLVSATVISCVLVNVFLPEEYISIAIPGGMFKEAYDKRGIPREELAFAAGVGGATTSALVPWNTCGVFIKGVLGVSTLVYFPFAMYNLLTPLLAVAWAFVPKRNQKSGTQNGKFTANQQ